MKGLIVLCALVAATVGLPDGNGNGNVKRIGFPTGRVVGGVNAQPGQAPYIVTMQWFPPGSETSRHSCGGSILDENWILTAAHCIVELPEGGRSMAVAGEHDQSTTSGNEQARDFQTILIHQDYTGGVSPFDIALIRVNASFVFNDHVQAIGLPVPNSIATGQARLFGWGSTSDNEERIMPNILQTVEKPIIEYAECEAIFGGPGVTALHPTNLCTGPLTQGTASCSGDSGGPLVQANPNGVNQLVGIVSWGEFPCGQANSPSVYVRVSAFYSWINNNRV